MQLYSESTLTLTADTEGLLGFLHTFERAAPVELAGVFDLAPSELERQLDALEAPGAIRRVPAGNGCVFEANASGGGCDPVTGLCAL